MPTKNLSVTLQSGLAGFGQQTPATRALLGTRSARTTTRKKRRKVAKKKAAPKRRRVAAKKRAPARLVKGSAAARAHMAKLRKMRRK